MRNVRRRSAFRARVAALFVLACLPLMTGCNLGVGIATLISTAVAITNAFTPGRMALGAFFLALVNAI